MAAQPPRIVTVCSVNCSERHPAPQEQKYVLAQSSSVPKPPVIWSYGIAVLSITSALIISRWPALHLEAAPVSLFLCAVMLSAWFGGVAPGLLATTLSGLAPSLTAAWDCPHSRRNRSSMPSLLPSRTGPAWDFASAAPSSNRMVAACGLPTTSRAAQSFVSPYPPKPRRVNDARGRSHGVRH